MSRRRLWLPALLLAVLAAGAQAAAPLRFNDPAEEARFHALTSELRCVQCQNQSLADSDALVARDMRRQVLVLMRQGHSDEQVRQWLVQRYGDFVLYRPRLDGRTAVLWLGPLLLLAAGGTLGWQLVRRRGRLLAAQGDRSADTGDGGDW